MTLLLVDGSGRLAEFLAVPQPVQADNAPTTFDWRVLFEVAGLDMTTFKPVDPQWIPPVYADERRAWEGPVPELPGQMFFLQ